MKQEPTESCFSFVWRVEQTSQRVGANGFQVYHGFRPQLDPWLIERLEIILSMKTMNGQPGVQWVDVVTLARYGISGGLKMQAMSNTIREQPVVQAGDT